MQIYFRDLYNDWPLKVLTPRRSFVERNKIPLGVRGVNNSTEVSRKITNKNLYSFVGF